MSLAHLPHPWRRVVVFLLGLALLALVGQVLVYVDYAAALFRFPFDYDQGEGFELYDTLLHARGEWPYRDSQVYPFYTSIYPPVFHLLTVPLVWAFGPQLWTGRAVGFAASLVAAGAIAWGVHRAAQNRVVALLSGLTFLASNYTFHVGPLFRQHMTMVMFEVLAMVALAQAAARTDWHRSRALGVGLLCLLLAGYAKPLALATVLAGLTFLFLRGPRRALLAGLALAVTAGLLFLAIDLATDGWFYVSVVRANVNDFDLAQALGFYRQWASLHLLLLLAAAARLLYETYWARLSAYAVWFAFTLGNNALSGKFGAGESYFITSTAAAAVLAGIAVAELWRRSTHWRPRSATLFALAVPALYLAQARLTLHLYTTGPVYAPVARALGIPRGSGYYDSQGYTQLGPRPTATDVEAGWAIATLARQAPGPVFSEEAGFMFAAGKPVVTNPFPQLLMHKAGIFDPAREIEMINARAFGLVILRAQFYPPPVLAALGANYQPLTEVHMNGFVYRLLEPRP